MTEPSGIIGYSPNQTSDHYTQDDFLRALYSSIRQSDGETLNLSQKGTQFVQSVIPNFPNHNSNLETPQLELVRQNIDALYAKVDTNKSHTIDTPEEAAAVNALFVGQLNGVKGEGEVQTPQPLASTPTNNTNSGVGFNTNIAQTIARLEDYKARIAKDPNYNPIGLHIDNLKTSDDLFSISQPKELKIQIDNKDQNKKNDDIVTQELKAPKAPASVETTAAADKTPTNPAIESKDVTQTPVSKEPAADAKQDAAKTPTDEVATSAEKKSDNAPAADKQDITATAANAIQPTAAQPIVPQSAPATSGYDVVTVQNGDSLSQILLTKYPELFSKNGKPDWAMLPLATSLLKSLEKNGEVVGNNPSPKNDGFWLMADQKLSLPKDSAALMALLTEKSKDQTFIASAEETRQAFSSKYKSKAFAVNTSDLLATLTTKTEPSTVAAGSSIGPKAD